MTFTSQWRAWFNQYLEPAQAWYRQRDTREQRALLALGAALLVTLFWWLVWQPLYEGREQARTRYIRAAQTLSWIQDNAPAVRGARDSEASSPATGDGWSSRISSSASAHNLKLKGFTPEGSNSVRVMLEEQSFAHVTSWLQSLRSEEGVRVSNIEISRGNKPGGVNVRATLARGS